MDINESFYSWEKEDSSLKSIGSGFIALALMLAGVGEVPVSAQAEEAQKVIVVFEEQADMKEAIEEVGGSTTEEYAAVDMAAAELTPAAIAELQQDPRVLYIEEDAIVELQGQMEDWGIASSNIPEAWNSGFTGKGVKISVIDSGISPHEDLRIAGGTSTVSYTNSYADDQGHGTHVAGIIGGLNNGYGVKGVAYNAELYAVKAFDAKGQAYVSDMIEGIDWSVAKGMDIINLSAGSQTGSTAFKSAVDKAYASGLLIVAAAGNDGNSTGAGDTVDFPARYPSVIAVGAVDRYSKRADFSSTGSTLEVTAPGERILSTYTGNQYAYLSGTSMATPYVAGVLALIKQAYPNSTNQEARQILIGHTRDVGPAGRDPYYGYGIIQASSFEPVTRPQQINAVTSLALNEKTLSGAPGDQFSLSAAATYQDGSVQNVTPDAIWSSADRTIATVANGKVQLNAYGSTTITATFSGKSATATITVPQPEANPVVKLETDQTNFVGKPGDVFTVSATALFKNGQKTAVTNEASWHSNNEEAATVTNGKITVRGYGIATIMLEFAGQTATVVVNSPNPQAAPNRIHFDDVPSFYAPAVDYLVQRGITQGKSAAEFGVADPIIRADAAIWLAKELELDTAAAKPSGFGDVPERAAGAVNSLKQAGIIGGKTATRFGSSDPLSRGEVAIILQRAYKLESGNQRSAFTDVSTRYAESVNALVANRVTDGLTPTQFGVSRNITRGQLAVFIYRLAQ